MNPIRTSQLLVLITLLAVCVTAARPASFCKCTCFNSNSTIIKLDAEPPVFSGVKQPRFLLGRSVEDEIQGVVARGDEIDGRPSGDDRRLRATTCNDCNRQLCIEYNLPSCQNAEESEIYTTCFQRDSTKDQAVVYIFIIATVGLLTWAVIRPYAEKYMVQWKERSEYIPITDREMEDS